MSTVIELDELLADPGQPALPGSRAATATLRLNGGQSLPQAADLAKLLSASPVSQVEFVDPLDLSTDSSATIARTVAVLRECSSLGASVRWTLRTAPGQGGLVGLLDHLPAPQRVEFAGGGDQPVTPWRSDSYFGLFYFRRGPGFLSVVDQRPESGRRLVIDDPARMAVFRRCHDGCAWAELATEPGTADAAGDLLKAGLLLRPGDGASADAHLVTLPVHMRTWPIGSKLL
ncbi:MAG: hypothetical protein JWQ01_4679, partial [Massilia sp.]|nr:hypothetical protein [Massilia sp.]